MTGDINALKIKRLIGDNYNLIHKISTDFPLIQIIPYEY
jgi:hypothetical protein